MKSLNLDQLVEFGFETWFVLFIASSIVLSVAWILTLLFKRMSAAQRCSIWITSMIVLLVVPMANFCIPKVPMGLTMPGQSKVVVHTSTEFDEQTKRADINALNQPRPGNLASVPNELKTSSSQDLELGNVIHDDAKSEFLPQLEAKTGWKTILILVWLVGLIWCVARIIRSLLFAHQLSRDSYPAMDKINSNDDVIPEVYLSGQTSLPLTIGIFSPRVILPLSSIGWNPERLKMVLRHEFAHIRRRDVTWNVLVNVSHALVWFQPLAWLAIRKTELERERACDDCVLRNGSRASDYATLLLEMGAELSGMKHEPSQSIGAMSMAQKPIESRMSSILSLTAQRRQSSLRFRWFITSLLGIAVITFCIMRPFEKAQAVAQVPDEKTENPTDHEIDKVLKLEKLVLPEVLTSQVLDYQNNPIADAQLALTIRTFGETYEVYKDQTLKTTTDQNGEYRIETNGIEFYRDRGVLIWGTVEAQGQLARRVNHKVVNNDKGTILSDTILVQPRTLVGRIAGPEGRAVKDGRVRFVAGNQVERWWNIEKIKCDQNGTFETLVPHGERLAMFASGNGFVQKKTIVNPNDNNVSVKLESGTSLHGKVTDQNGLPIAGSVVVLNVKDPLDNGLQANAQMDLTVRSYSFAVKTDEFGMYRLPPAIGECVLHFDHSGMERDTHKFLRSDVKQPLIAPQKLHLNGEEGELEVNLQQKELVALQGTVRWKDGNPVPDATAIVNVWPGGSDGYPVEETKTNNEGRYSLHAPKGTRVSISVFGATDSDGKYQIAAPNNDVAPCVQSQHQRLGVVSTDLQQVDWELGLKVVPPCAAEQQ